MLLFGEQVELLYGYVVQHGLAGLDDDVFLIVDDLVKLFARDVEQGAYLVGQGAEEPDMSHRNSEFDVSHTLTAHFLLCYLDTATVADNALITNAFIFATVAFPVACGTENALAEQTVALRLVGAVVDSLGLGDFAVGASLD